MLTPQEISKIRSDAAKKYGIGKWMKGRKLPHNSLACSERMKGDKNPCWKGDKVCYAALHKWIRKNYKKPPVCEKCGTNPGQNSIGRTLLQWANRTRKYLRDREDWICLCAKCHGKYDSKNKKKRQYTKDK